MPPKKPPQFSLQQTRASIDHLFKDLWPMMAGVGERYGDCIEQCQSIQFIINHQPDHDARLKALVQLRGVKATIGSGLLWAFFMDECVPFDKHTTAYCVMDWKIIADPKITNGTYSKKCAAIVANLPRHSPALPAIEDLVIWARDHCSMEFLRSRFVEHAGALNFIGRTDGARRFPEGKRRGQPCVRGRRENAVIQGILFSEAGGAPRIRELEVSITQRCNLACAQCGFMVPNQPPPAHGDVTQEAAAGLSQLGRLGIRIGTLVVLGGEPTLDGARLVRTLRALRGVGNFDRLEVVSNGLHPQGLTVEALQYIDRFVISVYFDEPALSELWRRWLTAVAPHVELQLRVHADGWDRWTGDEQVDETRAQQLYDACWYRKHCVTVERGRLFACSRIPKLARDAEGLPLTDGTTLAAVTEYLNGDRFLPSCQTCVPMMGLGTVTPGVQPDDRIARLTGRAIAVLSARVATAESRAGADS